MDRFLKLARLEDSELLQYMIRHDHNAFVLLTVIAQRARRMRDPHPASGRKQYEAEIGDYAACGMSERNYRTAKGHLERWGLATFKPTSKGTIATLINGMVFDINPEEGDGQPDRQATGRRRAGDGQATTKKNDKKGKNGENGRNVSSASGDAPKKDSYCGLSGVALERFNTFWTVFNYKVGKADAAKTWRKLEPVANELFLQILAGAKREAAGRDARRVDGLTPKMAQGWLSGQRWEDEWRNKDERRENNHKRATRKADSVGRASGGGLPEL